jgi:F-type H+-transporting ATPase subunit b
MVNINATIILTMLNFILLVVLMRAILFKPLLRYLDERSKRIAESIRQAEENKKQAEEMVLDRDSLIQDARLKASEIVEKSKALASDESREIIRDARVQAQAIVDSTRDALLSESEKIKYDLRRDIATMVVRLSEQVLAREIQENDQKDIIERGLKTLGV